MADHKSSLILLQNPVIKSEAISQHLQYCRNSLITIMKLLVLTPHIAYLYLGCRKSFILLVRICGVPNLSSSSSDSLPSLKFTKIILLIFVNDQRQLIWLTLSSSLSLDLLDPLLLTLTVNPGVFNTNSNAVSQPCPWNCLARNGAAFCTYRTSW